MKKIAFVTPWFADGIPGGAESALRGLVYHLNEIGTDVEILATCVEKFGSDWNINFYPEGMECIKGVPVRRFPVRQRDVKAFDQVNYKLMNNIPISYEEEEIFLREMVNSVELEEYIEKHVDEYSLFVFTPYMFGTTYYGIQRCLEKAVLIPCLHDESYAYMKHFKEVFPKVLGMAFLSEVEYELAHRLYDLSAVNTWVLGTGVETDIVTDANRFRGKYGILSPFIVYAGRKDVGKNVHTLLEYFAKYKKRNKEELKLVLLGGGNIEIPEQVQDDVYDLGFVSLQDKYDACSAAEFLCNPSKFESFSLVIMESWLCKRPVVVYEGCEVVKRFTIEANGGLYFDNYFEFEQCVKYVLEHGNVAIQMGENGRQ